MKKQNVMCPKCENHFEETPKHSLLAFLKFTCPKCSEKFQYPISSWYRTFYWFVLIVIIMKSIVIISQWDIPVFWLLGLVSIFALIKDFKLKNKLKKCEWPLIFIKAIKL